MNNFPYCVYCTHALQCKDSKWACTFDNDGVVCDNLSLNDATVSRFNIIAVESQRLRDRRKARATAEIAKVTA